MSTIVKFSRNIKVFQNSDFGSRLYKNIKKHIYICIFIYLTIESKYTMILQESTASLSNAGRILFQIFMRKLNSYQVPIITRVVKTEARISLMPS